MQAKFSAVIILNNKSEILFVRRSSTAPWMPLKWSLPGGTIEKNETSIDAAIRETFEEVDLTINIALLVPVKDPNHIQYYFCPPEGWAGTPCLKLTDGILENDQMSWETIETAQRLDLLPGLLDKIKSYFSGE